MIPLMLLFLAPIFQIVLSIFRITNRISMPLGVIAFFSFGLGIIASIAVLNMEINELKDSHLKCLDCGGMVAISYFVIGFIMTSISTPVICLICCAFYNINQKNFPK